MFSELLLQTSKTKSVVQEIGTNLEKESFLHVISLNPENVVLALNNHKFREIYFSPDAIAIADGVGIILASRIIGNPTPNRLTGADLMPEIVKEWPDKRIIFLGGKNGVAQKVVENFKCSVNKSGDFVAVPAIDKRDVGLAKNVSDLKPDILFVAFGSPFQELWIEQNKQLFPNTVCIGVGGGFDFVAGVVPRAPEFVRSIGLEWMFRLVVQPWRIKRQLKLIEFAWLTLLARLDLV